MTQQIDPVKLKAAAEHLEWVCQQYPDNDDVQGLYRGLQTMIEDAKAGRVTEPVADFTPYRWAVSIEGMYRQYTDPDVEGAFYKFRTEMEGGLSDAAKQIIADFQERMKIKSQKEGDQS
jgi:hypothetical protein